MANKIFRIKGNRSRGSSILISIRNSITVVVILSPPYLLIIGFIRDVDCTRFGDNVFAEYLVRGGETDIKYLLDRLETHQPSQRTL